MPFDPTSTAVALAEHYGKEVWTNQYTDALRRKVCLCNKCERRELWGCEIAKKLFAICVEDNLAVMVTRCPYWIEKEKDSKTHE